MAGTIDSTVTRACSDGPHQLADSAYLIDGNLVCLRHAIMRRTTRTRSLKVAAVVGTVLFAINQLDTVIRGDHGPVVIAKILLTYAVPFAVATFAALAAVRTRP